MDFNQWVSTVDNASSIFMAGMAFLQTIIAFLQTILIGAGFWFGMKYLEQHKEKEKATLRLKIIYDSISIIRQLRKLSIDFIGTNVELTSLDPNNTPDLETLVNDFAYNIIISFERNKEKIGELRDNLRTNILLLKNDKISIYTQMIFTEETILINNCRKGLKGNKEFDYDSILKVIDRIPDSFHYSRGKKETVLSFHYKKLIDAFMSEYFK